MGLPNSRATIRRCDYATGQLRYNHSMTFLSPALIASHVRPFQSWRDALPVSRLLEVCFEMNREHRQGWGMFLDRVNRWMQMPFLPDGYVWEERGEIVGNISLIRIQYRRRSIVLIANVAVHPDFRRRGIARALLEVALESPIARKAGEIWLHVRADNEGAIALYEQLGFQTRAKRTIWHAFTSAEMRSFDCCTLHSLSRAAWPQAKSWLEAMHPVELGWYHQWNWEDIRPAWETSLWHWLMGLPVQRWMSLCGKELQAVLIWYPSPRNENGLWLASAPNIQPEAIQSLLWAARRALYLSRRTVYLEHPSGDLDEVFRSAGFFPLRTLLWMRR